MPLQRVDKYEPGRRQSSATRWKVTQFKHPPRANDKDMGLLHLRARPETDVGLTPTEDHVGPLHIGRPTIINGGDWAIYEAIEPRATRCLFGRRWSARKAVDCDDEKLKKQMVEVLKKTDALKELKNKPHFHMTNSELELWNHRAEWTKRLNRLIRERDDLFKKRRKSFLNLRPHSAPKSFWRKNLRSQPCAGAVICGKNYAQTTDASVPGPKYTLKRDFEAGGKGVPIADKGTMYPVDVDNCRGAPNKRNGPFPSSQDYKPEKAYAFWESSFGKHCKFKRGQGALKIMMKGTHKPIYELGNLDHPAPNQYRISPVYDGRKPNLSLGKGTSFSTASR